MYDNILTISKVGIKSIFTAKKYDSEILGEDLHRILFIRNYIEECSLYVKETCKDIDVVEYFAELKKYALEMFLIQCEEATPNEEKNRKDFNLEAHQQDDTDYFNYIFDHLKYPKPE
jgi:hypothetical protein